MIVPSAALSEYRASQTNARWRLSLTMVQGQMMAVDARRCEQGTALVAVLMVLTMLASLSAAVVLVTTAESRAAANHYDAQVALYAADAAIEHTMSELRTAGWGMLPGGFVSAHLWDDEAAPRAPDGSILDLASLTALRQAESDAVFGPSANRPRWILFGHGAFSDLMPAGTVVQPVYLLVWVADDDGEADGDPGRDSNNFVLVRAEAFAVSGARRGIDASLSRQTGFAPGSPDPAGVLPPVARVAVRLSSWREVR